MAGGIVMAPRARNTVADHEWGCIDREFIGMESQESIGDQITNTFRKPMHLSHGQHRA